MTSEGHAATPAFSSSSCRHFACGLLILASGGLAAAIEPEAPSSVASFAAGLLLASGSAELAVGMTGRYAERRVDVVLGSISLVAGTGLLLAPPGSGYSLASLVTTWLLARASVELLAALVALSRDQPPVAVRFARAGFDLLLGLASVIFSASAGLVEILLGWPSVSMRAVLTAAGASMIAAGGVQIALAWGAARRLRDEESSGARHSNM